MSVHSHPIVLETDVKLFSAQMRYNRELLRAFVDRALQANITYFAVRRELYGLFTAALDRNGDVLLESQEVITIRTLLTSREQRINDQARLAYEVALNHIYELVEPP